MDDLGTDDLGTRTDDLGTRTLDHLLYELDEVDARLRALLTREPGDVREAAGDYSGLVEDRERLVADIAALRGESPPMTRADVMAD